MISRKNVLLICLAGIAARRDLFMVQLLLDNKVVKDKTVDTRNAEVT